RLLIERLLGGDLRDDGGDTIPVIGDAAIRGVVAVPTHVGVIRVEVGQLELCDAPSGAVHQEPSAALPQPARRRLRRQRVVDPIGAADYEHTVGDVVCGAGGVLL